VKNKTIIFGAPGCGKTHYLLNLLEELLTKYKPHEIAFVSFTRRGAYEGKVRARERFGYSLSELPYFRTLHSLAFADAELSKGDVLQRHHYREFSEAMGMSFTGYYTEDFNGNDDRYLFYYFLKKNNINASEAIVDDLDMLVYERVARGYDKFKKQRGLIDYTDMLTFFVDRNQSIPVKVAIIDEAQDLTSLQWKMCDIAFKDCDHVYIAGDDDQAIYEWNGADVEHFLSLDGERVILDKSYRVPSRILDFSKNFTRQIRHRVDKVFAPRELGGEVWTYNNITEVPFRTDENYYVLARNNYHLSKVRSILRRNSLVFMDKTKSSVDTRVIRGIIAYEHRRRTGKFANEVDELIVSQLMTEKDNFDKPWYSSLDIEEEDSLYYRDLIANKTNLQDSNITVNTIHGVKGGEADNVVLLMDFTARVDKNFMCNTDSELRCLYVGATRAKKKLHVVFSESNYGYDNHMDMNQYVLNAYKEIGSEQRKQGNVNSTLKEVV
jgi:superfamily I DNA/RNA helicase